MKAYQLPPGAAYEALTLVDRRPARAVGANDARVHVRSASLNNRDLNILRRASAQLQSLGKQKSETHKAPIVPLSDGAGEVIAVGVARRSDRRMAILLNYNMQIIRYFIVI